MTVLTGDRFQADRIAVTYRVFVLHSAYEFDCFKGMFIYPAVGPGPGLGVTAYTAAIMLFGS